MDIVAHALWANLAAELVTRRKRVKMRRLERAWAMLGAVAPDFVPFFPYLLVSLFGSGGLLAYFFTRWNQEWGTAFMGHTAAVAPAIPPYVYEIYSYTHSALVWGVVTLVAFAIMRRVSFWQIGWGTHIALDVFTHDAGHFPTKVLYPLSEFHLNGTAWSNPLVFVCTYVALLLCYLAVYTRRTHTL